MPKLSLVYLGVLIASAGAPAAETPRGASSPPDRAGPAERASDIPSSLEVGPGLAEGFGLAGRPSKTASSGKRSDSAEGAPGRTAGCDQNTGSGVKGCGTEADRSITATIPLAASDESRLKALIEADWEWRLRESPFHATDIGDPRYNDRVTDLSSAAIAARHEYARALLGKIEAIDSSKLSPAAALNHELFLYEAKEAVASQRFPDELLQVSQMGGPHSRLAEVAEDFPRRRVKDWEDFLKRMRAFPRYLEQATALLRQGAEKGVTPPRVILEALPAQIANQLADDPTKTPIYTVAFGRFPASIAPADVQRLRQEAVKVLTADVLPALRRFHRFIESDYLPRTASSIARTDLPDGAAWYAQNVKVETSLEASPEEIHQLGLAEVKRIRSELESIQRAAGFRGTLGEFFTFMRTDKRFFAPSAEALLLSYRAFAKRIDGELPRVFGRLPRLPYGVDEMAAHKQKTAPAAYYQGGSEEGARAGRFEVNTYNLGQRPTWELQALTLHEAVPGHHLQIALAQELGDLPAFRRWGGLNAFIEGWGLYAESLGKELGFYEDPYSQFGRATFEMWRAVRLVVDTGIHAKGWSREQAVRYFSENAGKSDHDIRVEVDRYIAWPGQALGYKMGELRIKALRAAAERELGPRFDVRAFHDQVLGAGPLPLKVLERRIQAWIAAEKKAAPPR